MKNWIPKKTLIIVIASGAIVSFLIYVGALSYIYFNIKKIESYYLDTESKSGREERSKIIKSFVDENENYISTLRTFFIKKGDEILFIERIESLAKDFGLKFIINSIDVGKDSQDSFKEDVSVKMNLEGEWNKLIGFVNKLENTDFGVSIKSFDISKNSKTDWSLMINFNVFREK